MCFVLVEIKLRLVSPLWRKITVLLLWNVPWDWTMGILLLKGCNNEDGCVLGSASKTWHPGASATSFSVLFITQEQPESTTALVIIGSNLLTIKKQLYSSVFYPFIFQTLLKTEKLNKTRSHQVKNKYPPYLDVWNEPWHTVFPDWIFWPRFFILNHVSLILNEVTFTVKILNQRASRDRNIWF